MGKKKIINDKSLRLFQIDDDFYNLFSRYDVNSNGNKMTSYSLKSSSAAWRGCLLVVALVLHFQSLRVFGFHCHKKHDHSADILLQGISTSSEHYIQNDKAEAIVASYSASKLVQQ